MIPGNMSSTPVNIGLKCYEEDIFSALHRRMHGASVACTRICSHNPYSVVIDVMFGLLCLVALTCKGDVPPLTIVSAANSRYALKEVAVMLEVQSLAKREDLEVRLIVYNLGGLGRCASKEQGGLTTPSRLWNEFRIEYREFEFAKYPNHVSALNCYAWKPPIIAQVAREVGNESVVMWIDSGVSFHQRLRSIMAAARRNRGFLSDNTVHSIARFTHEATLWYFVDHFGFSRTFAQQLAVKRRSNKYVVHPISLTPKCRYRSIDSLDGLDGDLAVYRNCNGAFSAHIFGTVRTAPYELLLEGLSRSHDSHPSLNGGFNVRSTSTVSAQGDLTAQTIGKTRFVNFFLRGLNFPCHRCRPRSRSLPYLMDIIAVPMANS